ncbi:MAG: protein-glutamate O-methyltransferase CheR, partial [Deltaproteobacteria bacterium]|nr:protein-glutamate O-methyltransferase CheR [Deltaproteobacteria bacterium]
MTTDFYNSSELILNKEAFLIICNHIQKSFGILFSSKDMHLIESRLAKRVIELNLGSFDEYVAFLTENSRAELKVAIEYLTNNETYFFREETQLESFSSEFLPQLKKRINKQQQITIWSAGCSSGEEVYTIAMLINDSGLFNDIDVRVLGTDINSLMIANARKGIYGESSFRNTSEQLRRRHFVSHRNSWKINEKIRSMCNFSTMNILNDDSIYVIGKFDIIFCRNVLIYFNQESKLKAVS